MPAPSPLKRLLAFALRHRSMALLQLSLAIAGTLLILVFPGIVQRFIDEIIPSKQTHLIWSAGGLAVAAFLVREMLFYVRTRVNTEFEQRMIIDLRSQLHRKISHLPIAWFDRQSTGDILTFASAQADTLAAISLGAVFFGAMTYIGNGPNFMVKAISEHAKVGTPSFLGYIGRFAVPILLPFLALIGILFFSRWRIFG